MSQRYKILSIIFGCLYLPILVSQDNSTFQNISIQSDQVTIDEETRRLDFKNNIRIKIDNYILKGSNALLSHQNKKLEIYGNPATIKSNTIDGEAEVLVIYPNKSMHLIGNAKLLNKGNSITSNLIAYQISSNE
jgi:lipopolysaccharide transport protein LptA|tara:strand:+ start:1607 stop:2008 length:402 start_codon:yes stop_codon:yes gene_type:complete